MRPGDLFSLDFEDSHGRPCQLAQGAGAYPQLFLYTPTEMVILDPGLAEWVGDWMREWGERYPDVAPRPRYVPSPAAASLPDPTTADVELRAFLVEWITRHGLTEEQVGEALERAAVTVKGAVRPEGEAS